jgi:hypothetical protein
MSCMCLRKLKTFLESLKNLPLNMLASLIPKDIMPQLPMLGSMAYGLSSASFMMSPLGLPKLNGGLGLRLPQFSLPMLELAKLESMAQIAGMTGTNPLYAKPALQRMATSANVNLPGIMQMLMELLNPLIDPLMDLLALLQTFNAVQTAFGVNLAVPGAMPRLAMALSARINLPQAPPFDLQAAMDLGSYGRAMRAASSLGFDLSKPAVGVKFTAALNMAIGLPIPPLTIDLPQMNTLANLLQALAPIQKSMLGINMTLPKAWDLLAAALSALLGNLLEPLKLSADHMGSLADTARWGSYCNAVPPALGMPLSLPIALRLNSLPLNLMPDLGGLAATARFGEATGLNVWSSSPCSASCPVGRMF